MFSHARVMVIGVSSDLKQAISFISFYTPSDNCLMALDLILVLLIVFFIIQYFLYDCQWVTYIIKLKTNKCCLIS